jgi:hypothetical protein
MFIAAYVGARPLGRPLPPLAEVPQHPTVPLHLIYSFARDAAGDGRFMFYDPWQLDSAVAQQCGSQRGMLSLGGAGYVWAPAVGLDAWVAAALDSLQHMLTKYRLMGLDINVEEGLDSAGGFPEAMAALIAHLKAWRPHLLVTVSPYSEIWSHYRRLLQVNNGPAAVIGPHLRKFIRALPSSNHHCLATLSKAGVRSVVLGRRPMLDYSVPSVVPLPSAPAHLPPPTPPPPRPLLGPIVERLQLAGPSIDYINWQLYAELESPSATAEQVGIGGGPPTSPCLSWAETQPQSSIQPLPS